MLDFHQLASMNLSRRTRAHSAVTPAALTLALTALPSTLALKLTDIVISLKKLDSVQHTHYLPDGQF